MTDLSAVGALRRFHSHEKLATCRAGTHASIPLHMGATLNCTAAGDIPTRCTEAMLQPTRLYEAESSSMCLNSESYDNREEEDRQDKMTCHLVACNPGQQKGKEPNSDRLTDNR